MASWSAPLGEIAAGDLDSNGTLDLVAGVVGGSGVVVLPGTGGGAFGVPFPIEVDAAGEITEVDVVDIDGDALEDLVVGKGSGGIAVRRGTGLGSLAPTDLRGPFDVGSVAIGDVDGDGRLDAVSAGLLPPATVQFGEPVGWWTSLGVGCPGLGGHAPSLSIPACHDPSTQLGIRLEGGPGGAPALVLIGDAAPSMPIGWSLCSLGVDATQVLPVPLGGNGPGTGAAVLMFAVPPSAQGLSFAMQAAVKDEVSLPGFTMSNTLAFTLP
ncbi:MAG: FG-GAP repeat domain-containing protein [Planctomycetota bacterium JB042]